MYFEFYGCVMTNVFTRLLLGHFLHLDPLQLGEARRLCEESNKKSDDRQ